jgi:hypothetical protein
MVKVQIPFFHMDGTIQIVSAELDKPALTSLSRMLRMIQRYRIPRSASASNRSMSWGKHGRFERLLFGERREIQAIFTE